MLRLALLSALLAACYEPNPMDCTVECASAGDCVEGQVCGSDHMCAAPEIAGMCNATGDEPRTVSLVISIAGRGKVSIDHIGTCDSDSPLQGNCTFAVTPGMPQQLEAVEGKDRDFVAWTSTCSGSASTCTLTPVTALTQVGAKFE